MSTNEGISLASVRDFLVKNDGKVKNTDLVHHFRQQLNDSANKSKVRGEFKEIVHTIATVQTIDGEKYFVLKKPKEAPAVLRKPPRPAKARPVSGPPVFRGAKLEEVPLGSGAQSNPRRQSTTEDELPALSHPNKENRPLEKREGTDGIGHLVSVESVDSGLESNGGSVGSVSTSTFKMLQNQFLNGGSGSTTNVQPERLSRSNDDLDRMDDDAEGDDFLMGGPTAHLEPLEKEWLVSAAKGNRAQIMCLLEQDPNLATKKDFMQGYSAIHWAAKHGRADIVKLLASTGIDVNVRTNGGYTPLHLAAMHGRDAVIKMLVSEYEADINCRDFSGKKPKQVARVENLTIEAQALLEDQFRNYSDTSSESSGYGSLSKYGSLNSNPGVVMSSHHSNSEKGSGKNEVSDDKSRSRSSSIGKFLMKKRQKQKERAPVPHFPPSSTSAGLLISTPLSVESGSFEGSPGLISQRTYLDSNLLKSTGV